MGHTAFVPENDGYSITKSQLLARMDVAFGGRIAEEISKFLEKDNFIIRIFFKFTIIKKSLVKTK